MDAQITTAAQQAESTNNNNTRLDKEGVVGMIITKCILFSS
jgi:hypothetical protein